MMAMPITFEELQALARVMLERPIAFTVEDFVKKVEEWVNGPEQLKNSYIGFFGSSGGRMVKRSELPRVLREDPDFREKFIRFLAGG